MIRNILKYVEDKKVDSSEALISNMEALNYLVSFEEEEAYNEEEEDSKEEVEFSFIGKAITTLATGAGLVGIGTTSTFRNVSRGLINRVGGDWANLKQLILKGESDGDLNIMQGASGTKDKRGIYLPKSVGLESMTVKEVLALQDKVDAYDGRKGRGGATGAAGLWQVMPATLRGIIKAGIISENDLFNRETQDKIGTYLIERRIRLAGGLNESNLDNVMEQLAMEWRSLPSTILNPGGVYSKNPNKSLDKAQHSIQEVREALLKDINNRERGINLSEDLNNYYSYKTDVNDSKKADYNIDKVCNTLVSNAKSKGSKLGDCASYVRRALQEGSNKYKFGGLGHASNYDRVLPKIGFVLIGKNLKSCKKGDIAVFPKSSNLHNYGHVCIFTGSAWVSDFVQNTVFPNSSEPFWDYYVYRARSGYSNGSVVSTTVGQDQNYKEEISEFKFNTNLGQGLPKFTTNKKFGFSSEPRGTFNIQRD